MSDSTNFSKIPAPSSRPAPVASGKTAGQAATDATDASAAQEPNTPDSATPFDQVLSSQTPAQTTAETSSAAQRKEPSKDDNQADPSAIVDPLLAILPQLTTLPSKLPAPGHAPAVNSADQATLAATTLSAAMQQAIHAQAPALQPAPIVAAPTGSRLPGLQPTLPTSTAAQTPQAPQAPQASTALPRFTAIPAAIHMAVSNATPHPSLSAAAQLKASTGTALPAAAQLPLQGVPLTPLPQQANSAMPPLQTVLDTVAAVADAGDTPAGQVPLTMLHAPQVPLTPAAPASPIAAALVLAQPTDPSAGFDDSFTRHISLMAEQRISHAEIRVSPEHLGTINIRLQLDGNDLRAEFHSAHADVRHTLESSLPKLRDMLSQQGFQLTHAGVGQEQKPQQGNAFQAQLGEAPSDTVETDLSAAPVSRRANSLLDVYA